MTPMIDVVFLLLIFFVCAAVGYVPESLLPTELAAGSSVSTLVPVDTNPWATQLWLRLKRHPDSGVPVITLAGREFRDHEELRDAMMLLADETPDSPVVLDVSKDVALGLVIRVYDTCQAAGFASIHFAAGAENAIDG